MSQSKLNFQSTVMSEKNNLKKRVGHLPAGLAGTGPNGSFFEAPAWVDQTKAPGTTSQVAGSRKK